MGTAAHQAGGKTCFWHAGGGPDPLAPDELPEIWGASHAKEETFQQQKRRKIDIEAFHAGMSLPEEVHDSLAASAAAAEAKANHP